VSEADASKLFASNIASSYLIKDFTEFLVSRWIEEISDAIAKELTAGKNERAAIIATLPYSFLSGCSSVYFKLVDTELPDDDISIITEAVASVKVVLDEKNAMMLKNEDTIATLKNDIKTSLLELRKVNKSLEKCNRQIVSIKDKRAKEIKAQKSIFDKKAGELEKKLKAAEAVNAELREELNAIASGQALDMKQTSAKHFVESSKVDYVESKPSSQMAPIHFEEFCEYLGYNFNNIGVSNQIRPLLVRYIANVLFDGKPIVVDKVTGELLIKCVSNTLLGKQKVIKAVYPDLNSIITILESEARVVCLDNFIGNCNETELISVAEQHKDKIIFITAAYERSLYYISREFLKYCIYINLNRIGAFSGTKKLTEDPSSFEEEALTDSPAAVDKRATEILRKILFELEYPSSVIEVLCDGVSGDDDVDGILLFTVLPYCKDVMGEDPYCVSEYLQKYTVSSRRGSLRELYESWFL
jgi:hypothetical protein